MAGLVIEKSIRAAAAPRMAGEAAVDHFHVAGEAAFAVEGVARAVRAHEGLAGFNEFHQRLAWIARGQQHAGGVKENAVVLLEIFARDALDGVLRIDGRKHAALLADGGECFFHRAKFVALAPHHAVGEPA